MNFLETVTTDIDRDTAVVKVPGGGTLTVPARTAGMAPGAKATLGVRPEHLVTGDQGAAVMEGRVFVVERLGARLIAMSEWRAIRASSSGRTETARSIRESRCGSAFPPPTAICSTVTGSRWTGSSGIRWPIWTCPGTRWGKPVAWTWPGVSEVDRRGWLGYAGSQPEQEPELSCPIPNCPPPPQANHRHDRPSGAGRLF